MNLLNIFKPVIFLTTLLCFCIFLTPSPLRADETEKTVIAMGIAVIQRDNLDGARQNALENALRNALEQGVDMVMNAITILEDDDLLEKIHTHSIGAITRHKIIKERSRKGNLEIKIKVWINTATLTGSLIDLGIIQPWIGHPRVLVLPAPNQPITRVTTAAETMLIKQLTDKKFDVVDPTKSRELHAEAKELLKADTINNVAALIGLNHHAEVVLLYKIQEGGAQFDGTMESAQVMLNGKAIVTSTAQILTTDQKNATGIGHSPDFARQNGASRAADELITPMMENIISWWWSYAANGLPYIVTLHTKPGADMQVISFQEQVEAIPGVMSLTERSSGGGITEMMVKYKFGLADFKKAIFSRIHGRNGFEKLATEVSKGRFLVLSTL